MANKTAEDIYGYAQDMLKFDGTDVGIPGMEEPRTLNWINDLQTRFFQEFHRRRITLPDYMASHTGFEKAGNTALAADASAGDTGFTVEDGDTLATSGAGVIYGNNQWNVFTHTTNSSDVVGGIPASGVGSMTFDHDAGNAVAKLNALPSDFGRFRPVKKHREPFLNHDGVMVEGFGYNETPEYPQSRQFALYKNASGSPFLWLPEGLTSGSVMVLYDRKPSEITETDDELDIPAPHDDYVVQGLVAIFKQVQDEDYEPIKEENKQLECINSALVKRSAAKPIMGNARFFGRMR